MSESLLELHEAHGAVFGERAGGRRLLHYGDAAGEAASAMEGVGLSDRGRGAIVAQGPQAGLFLNGLTTNNVEALPLGRLQENLICASKGKILHAVEILRTKADQYLVLTSPDDLEAVGAHLAHYHIREELQMGQAGLARLDLLGAGAAALLGGLAISPDDVAGRYGEDPLVTVSHPLGALPRIVMLLPTGNAAPFAESLLGAKPPARLIGETAHESLRIGERIPRIGVDYDDDHLPAEAALYTHLSFDKGCYVGQETHARMHHRGHPNRKLVALAIPDAAAADLSPGAPLFRDGKEVGHVTSLAPFSREGLRPAIAMVRYTVVTAGGALAMAPGGPDDLPMAPLATDLGAERQ